MNSVAVIVVGSDENDRFIVRHLCSKITSVGQCVEFESGDQALFALLDPVFLQSLEPHPPRAVVLLDIAMPGMSGLELLDRLAEIGPPIDRRILVIAMLTSSLLSGDLEKVEASVLVTRHLYKPLTAEALEDLIQLAQGSS